MTPTAGMSAIANAVADRFEDGDDEGRVVGDLLTVLAAVISDMPQPRQRLIALQAAGSRQFVANLLRKAA